MLSPPQKNLHLDIPRNYAMLINSSFNKYLLGISVMLWRLSPVKAWPSWSFDFNMCFMGLPVPGRAPNACQSYP